MSRGGGGGELMCVCVPWYASVASGGFKKLKVMGEDALD